ncbi:hypothetical protein B0I37DRAFT_65585 [Chaetomium sp. MPI-CAGE-AT-0009]|nr:hypothetical protein B0I37DRAFT_65585 [Chaetomium sp. MPI-CAGE-AT-0009]
MLAYRSQQGWSEGDFLACRWFFSFFFPLFLPLSPPSFLCPFSFLFLFFLLLHLYFVGLLLDFYGFPQYLAPSHQSVQAPFRDINTPSDMTHYY